MLVYEEIKNMRLKYCISQTKLAEFSGFSKAQIWAWELGKKVLMESELNMLNSVLKDAMLRISQGKLDVKKKKYNIQVQRKSCLQ